ncbi:MAG TPA: hypothetical protein VKW04_14185 [Planctomycetota bacterium]|nr:hypothetical protein [Planctomycetota bacterium]
MTNPILRTWWIFGAPALLIGCAAIAPAPREAPIRWIVVEKRSEQLFPPGTLGDGMIDPGARVLALEPLYREDLEWEVVVEAHDYFVDVLDLSPGTRARPGEVVTARVRVGRAQKGDLYRLTAVASRPQVQVLGLTEQLVREGTTAIFRFTSSSPGAGGIAVSVERVTRTPP